MKQISGKEFAKLLEKTGVMHRISVPIHDNAPLKAGLLAYLLKVSGLSANAVSK